MTNTEYMVTQKEAAEFLHVSTKSISRYRKRGLPYKLILNPVLGKQEVRFRYADLERWNEGRQLLATYARDGEEPTGSGAKADEEKQLTAQGADQGFLSELLIAYREQIEILRDQLEDMREQLGRRDRQIDDLMRLMVGLQLEYKPMASARESLEKTDRPQPPASLELFEAIALPDRSPQPRADRIPGQVLPAQAPAPGKKIFSREQLSASILRLRRKGKSFEEITRGLNRIEAATLSGQPQWTALEVKTLLPPLVELHSTPLDDEGAC